MRTAKRIVALTPAALLPVLLLRLDPTLQRSPKPKSGARPPQTAPVPIRIGANLPQVNRYSKEAQWGEAGGLAGWALKGRWARVPAAMHASFPEGFGPFPPGRGQVDLGQTARQMEVCRGCAGVLVLLSPSWTGPTGRGEWVPPRADWPAALAATRLTVAEYDRQAKRYRLPPPIYQIWNEASPGKPGGPRSGPPGEWSPALHAYLGFLTQGLGLPPERLVGPAISCLTDRPEEAKGELATCTSPEGLPEGHWESRVGALAVHLRLSGPNLDSPAYEARSLEIMDRAVDTLRALPRWKGRSAPVWITEAYVTPGDVGRPNLPESDLGAWREAALRAAARSKAAAFLPYGLRPSEIEGPNAWAKFGGWAPTLAKPVKK